MNFKTAHLNVNYTPRSTQILRSLDLRMVKNRLLDMGYEKILLSGALIEQFSEGIYLFVDDDVVHWLEAYLHLEELLLAKEPYQHAAFLNDGALTIKADVEFRYCPGLNIANLVTYNASIAADQYIWWWRNIAYKILNLSVGK
ncbi:hypothetical protein HJG54_34225 [Leptolyngbya sp. NK1-12]|uniref:Uncharacterized protein n=1 Tax=Leptolyngbya sp. NK1-12 TaxID=2547451 RepID=A0AA96WLT3_9CYAN|nr:hypothetical protein [Leptolyngbya sp. NK1-12]WNZ26904.1 hypothetical protein HJG54_28675 [Leptolyngbya sp. NK1-12]WNZ27883.1 hypothetical protein HJG54_34225 [Leptolyngbya sp. NK1-12]